MTISRVSLWLGKSQGENTSNGKKLKFYIKINLNDLLILTDHLHTVYDYFVLLPNKTNA